MGRGIFLGKCQKYNNVTAVFAAKGIIQSPITSYSRRDHSVTAALAANGIGREGRDGSAQRRQV